MKKKEKTKEQLINELAQLRQQIGELKKIEAKHEQAEEALRESESRFRNVVEHAVDAIFVVDPENMRIVDINQRACENLGYTRDQLLTLTVPDVHPMISPERFTEIWKQAARGNPVTIEGAHRHKDGTTLPVEVHIGLLEFSGRDHLLALVRDITERKQSEEALRENEERFRTLYKNTPVMMHSIDQKGQLVSVNTFWLNKLGYDYDEVIGRKVFEFYTKESARYAHEVAFQEFLKKGVIKDKEIQVIKKDGEVIDALLSAVGKWNEKGELLYSLAFLVDITDRKRMEEALRKSEEQFRDLYDEAPNAYLSVGTDGHIKKANRQAAGLFGYPINKLIGKLVFDLVADSPSGKPKAQKVFQRFLAGKESREEEIEFRGAEGDQIWGCLSVRPIQDVQENIVATRSMVVDITDRKQAEQALRESEERLALILESAMDAIITIDDSHKIVLFNEAAEKVFRCTTQEVLGRAIDRFLSESFRNLLATYLQNFINKRKKPKRYMWAPEGLCAHRADGEEFPIEATISEVEVSGQNLFTIILRDINERKKAEAELNKLQLQNVYLQEEIKSEYNFGEIIGATPVMKKVFKKSEKVAATDATVLLTGETGTGKELIARAIHNLSSRKDSVLVNVNCGALPGGLVESEFFGHEKGAFTGATTKKRGRFELADCGTIFLDEVGDLPLETQIKLLRVLQEQEFELVGGTQTLKVNVRVIAATNHNLEEAVNQGAFRADLFYRLNIFPIHMPPLRERIDDIPLLTDYFIRKFSRRIGRKMDKVDRTALEKLQNYDWPGNVRELANILERAVILCECGCLQQKHIGISIQQPIIEGALSNLEEAERMHILKALEKTGGVVGGPQGAAKLLGINRSTLWSRMKKLGIDVHSNGVEISNPI